MQVPNVLTNSCFCRVTFRSYVVLLATAAACSPSELHALEKERAQLLQVLDSIASSEL